MICTSSIRWLRWPCSTRSSLAACMHSTALDKMHRKLIFKGQMDQDMMMHSGCRSAVSLFDQQSRPFCIEQRSDWCLHEMSRIHGSTTYVVIVLSLSTDDALFCSFLFSGPSLLPLKVSERTALSQSRERRIGFVLFGDRTKR